MIKRHPNAGTAYTNRGEAYRQKGELDLALADLDRAIALDDEDSYAWFNRGITYSDRGNPDRAIENYNHAIKLKDDDPWYYNNRGNSYIDKQSRARVRRLRPRDQARSEICAGLVQSRHRVPRQERRRQGAGRFQRSRSGSTRTTQPAWGNRARVYRDRGDIDHAFADLNQSLKLNPKATKDAFARANLYFDRHQYMDALFDYDTAVTYDPKYASALNGRCITKAIVGRAQDGLPIARRR